MERLILVKFNIKLIKEKLNHLTFWLTIGWQGASNCGNLTEQIETKVHKNCRIIDRQLAKAMGITYGTVNKIIKNLRLPSGLRKWIPKLLTVNIESQKEKSSKTTFTSALLSGKWTIIVENCDWRLILDLVL